MPQKKSEKKSHAGQIRIIGGDWRGRKLDVVESRGLRPSGDRVRETLFNWLQWDIAGRRCLDLFAGSGALAFEALSRGAVRADLVDSAAVVTEQLRKSSQLLEADGLVSLHEMSWHKFLESSDELFDIVFVDPPFDDQLQVEVLTHLCGQADAPRRLSDGAKIYVETPVKFSWDDCGAAGYQLTKQKRLGDVWLQLLEYSHQI